MSVIAEESKDLFACKHLSDWLANKICALAEAAVRQNALKLPNAIADPECEAKPCC